jgi:multisubunit Na+/H+ antiporter MnhC subunit
MFGALYAIFTILIIVGFFGFMLLLGFAPVFMAIGIFNKGIFFSWLKTTKFERHTMPLFPQVKSYILQFQKTTDQSICQRQI